MPITIHNPMKLALRFLAAAIFLGVTVPVWSQADISADLETIRANRNMPGLSAMAIKNGRIVAQGAAGFRRQDQSTPLLVTDRNNIGSNTKWMTGTLVGRLVDRGVIAWTTRVRDVFPNYETFNAAFHNATIDQLLAHRAGVQDGASWEGKYWNQLMAQNGTMHQIRRWVSETALKDPPQVAPGTFLYSNQGYAVVGTMIEIVTGKDWEVLVEEEIFTPLRMETAMVGQVYDNALPPKAPVGHSLPNGQTVPVVQPAMSEAAHFRYQASGGPGGFVGCTLRDVAKFLHAHAISDISNYLTPATAARLQEPWTGAGTEGYGRGVGAWNRDWAEPGQALNHAGIIFGQQHLFWMAPERDFIMVVFTNCRSTDNRSAQALNDVAVFLLTNYSNSTGGPPLEDAGSLLNISTRMRVETGDNAMIGGFIVTGFTPKKVLLRAIGPSLPVNGKLADPTLELVRPNDTPIFNDNWQDAQETEIDQTLPPDHPNESAIIATLEPGAYTAIVRGLDGGTGVGLVEAYDLDQAAPSTLANISTRGRVQTGDNVTIGGFIVGGNRAAKILVRAIGPSLSGQGVTGALQDPTLELVDKNGTKISNDDWASTQEQAIKDTKVPPPHNRESAILATLPPDPYTAIVRGKDGTTGIALVEVYNIQ